MLNSIVAVQVSDTTGVH